MIRINLLTEAKAAAARKRGPVLPAGAKLNNVLFFGGFALGALYIAIVALTRDFLDLTLAKAPIAWLAGMRRTGRPCWQNAAWCSTSSFSDPARLRWRMESW